MDLCKRTISVFLVLAMAFSFMPTFAAATEADLFTEPVATEAEELTPPVETEALTETTVETTVPTDTLPDLIVSSETVPVIAETVKTLAAEEAETAATSGTCGENLTWEFNEATGVLTILGSGDMECFDQYESPWNSYREQIAKISLPTGLTAVGSYAFYECNQLVDVQLPEGLISIGAHAFSECTSMVNIFIPDSVTTIDDNAFYACINLETITIPANISYLGVGVFMCCKITAVKLPEGIKAIPNSTFSGCNLSSITIPSSVAEIGSYAFAVNPLRQIYFSGDACTIAEYAFSDVTATVYYPRANETWTSEVMQDYGGSLTWKEYVFEFIDQPVDCSVRTGRTAEFSVDTNYSEATYQWFTSQDGSIWTRIDDANTSKLKVIASEECDDCQYYCEATDFNGTTIVSNPAKLVLKADYPIIKADESMNATINVPGEYAYFSFTPQYSEHFSFYSNCNDDTVGCIYQIGENDELEVYASNDDGENQNFSVQCALTVGEEYILGARYYSKSQTGSFSVIIETKHNMESTVITASNCTQDGLVENTCSVCGYSTEEVIPKHHIDEDGVCVYCGSSLCGDNLTWSYDAETKTLTISGQGDMYGNNPDDSPWSEYCEEIEQIIIENGASSISGNAFYNCTQLSKIEIPNTVMHIAYSAFENCTSLQEVELPEKLETLDATVFQNCSSLRAIEIPGSVTKISYALFRDCSALTSVKLPENLTKIKKYAFANCSNLTEINIPDKVMELEHHCFENCVKLSTVKLPSTLEYIGAFSFSNCSSLEKIEFPNTLAEIGANSFADCALLKNVKFPESLIYLYEGAFNGCTNLTSIHFTGNAPEVPPYYSDEDIIQPDECFSDVVANAYYPANNSTWTENVMQNYGGELTWIAYDDKGNLSGTCGENVTWQLTQDGQMTISGVETAEAAAYSARSADDCRMDDYASAEETPWYDYQEQILTVTIEGTVDYVGSNAFSGCPNLSSVTIEDGVEEIHSTAFSDCPALETVYYAGSEEAWNEMDVDIGNAQVHFESTTPDSHTETKTTFAPTCTEKGYDLYECSCGSSRKENYTEALGHDLVNPTYDSSTKTHTFSCSRCEYTVTEDCTFNEGKIITEATEETPGEKEFTCTVCGGTYTEEFAYVAPEASSVRRISGKTRFDTAMAIADELKNELGIEMFKTIVVASGANFPDALAGSYLAVQKDAPILLTENNENSKINGNILNYIDKNLHPDGMVYILGGTASVSKAFTDGLAEAGIAFKRLSGKSRYDTNLKILEEATLNGNEILVCSGVGFADALSASAVNKPILLVNGEDTKLTDAQKKYLESLGDGYTFYIVGGTGAVSAELEEALAAYGSVERISGKGRHETSVAVAEKFFGDVDCAALAYSMNYPDGLCGGPLAYKLGAPLLLVKSDSEAPAAEYVKENNIKRGIVFGGTAGITDEAARTVFGLPEDSEIRKSNA